MPSGGRLTIETSNAYVDDCYAKEAGLQSGQFALIAVTDTGAGMDEAVMAQAFDPFFTTKEVGRGTGLGLSQVYGFVRQSGGAVKIYSEPGVGTTVKIYLPRHHGAAPHAVEQAQTQPPLTGNANEVIMVVEDDPRVRAVSVDALRELGYSVIEAADPIEALHLIEKDRSISLLFTDVVMPGMSGRELVERLRQIGLAVPVLYTTGYTRNAIVHNGILDPNIQLLSKPFTIEELARKVRLILDENSH